MASSYKILKISTCYQLKGLHYFYTKKDTKDIQVMQMELLPGLYNLPFADLFQFSQCLRPAISKHFFPFRFYIHFCLHFSLAISFTESISFRCTDPAFRLFAVPILSAI